MVKVVLYTEAIDTPYSTFLPFEYVNGSLVHCKIAFTAFHIGHYLNIFIHLAKLLSKFQSQKLIAEYRMYI